MGEDILNVIRNVGNARRKLNAISVMALDRCHVLTAAVKVKKNAQIAKDAKRRGRSARRHRKGGKRKGLSGLNRQRLRQSVRGKRNSIKRRNAETPILAVDAYWP